MGAAASLIPRGCARIAAGMKSGYRALFYAAFRELQSREEA
jgi:hypothetical protein